MNKGELEMTTRNISKPRNHVVLALLKTKRKAGKHEKTHKAERRADKVKTAKGQDYFCPF